MIEWEELFADERKRRGVIACFLAMLELTKLQKIFFRQDANFGKIRIFRKEKTDDDAETVAGEPGQPAGPDAQPAG
jgi:segregation and condensation protein A